MTEHDLDRPWIPEGARPFRVGDRVRVRLSGECRCSEETRFGLSRMILDGATGRVYEFDGTRQRLNYQDHNVYVRFEQWVKFGEFAICSGGAFLPIELEHLDDEVPS